jgi:hypothetical protein
MRWLPQVYFIQDNAGLVKIGYSANPLARLGNLQSAHATELRIIRVIDGGERTERWLHRRFDDQWVRGEWFNFHPDMMSVIPPDELPVRGQVKPKLRLTLGEFLKMQDQFGALAGHDRLLALTLVQSFWEDDVAAFIAWVRDRVQAPPEADPLQSTWDAAGEAEREAFMARNNLTRSDGGAFAAVTVKDQRANAAGVEPLPSEANPPSSKANSSRPKAMPAREAETPPSVSRAIPSSALSKAGQIRLLRPNCRHADDLEKCAGSARRHCRSCEVASAEGEAA